MKRKYCLIFNISIIFMIVALLTVTPMAGSALADDPDEETASVPGAGEEALFTTTMSPDALIILDLSGSMLWTPAGGTLYVSTSHSCNGTGVPHYTTPNSSAGITRTCSIDAYGSTTPIYAANASCTGPFYTTSTTARPHNCRRVMIARKALFDLLDDNSDGVINQDDEGSLGVRIGYMRFKDGDDTASNYGSGNNRLIRAIGSKYSLIYCGRDAGCSPTSSSGGASIINDWPNSGTPLVASLNEARAYLNVHKAADDARNCRQKFVILVSDGADTYSCSGNGSESQSDMDRRRRQQVAAAKALADAGYKVFVIGFGDSMPENLKNTLNWMAYFGGTENPGVPKSGSTSGYNPSAATSCGPSSTVNDPGTAPLSGYAFITTDTDQLTAALRTAMTFIRQANYSFSQSSVQSTRTADENYLFEGSFEPSDIDPFWKGHLKKYQINSDGTVGSVLWDAGIVLQDTAPALRTIKTYKSSALINFTVATITPADLGVETAAQRDAVVGYVRGESAHNPDNWKLGDVFRSTPITVGSPSALYDDIRDVNRQFNEHRLSHERTSALGNRLIVAGANAGQFHAFKTGNGAEAWSFVPPNLLTKLKNIAHASHPTSLTHQYFVDGPVTVADAWWGEGDGRAKADNSWKTILIFGLGRGADGYAWSSSASCDTGISPVYVEPDAGTGIVGYPYFCGYHALNLNDSLNPSYLWSLNFTDTTARTVQAPYLGQPWSKMMVGRVRIDIDGTDTEKWVGFVGTGYHAADCKGATGSCDPRGKGFFVIDLSNGRILWSYTYGNDTGNMAYSIPGTPAIVDTDNDGFVDTAYIGDLGGNVWRFKFCRKADMSTQSGAPSCTISGSTDDWTYWSGGLFYNAYASNQIRPIYTSPAVARDTNGYTWVYWGTGDKTDPTAIKPQDHFYALRDVNRNTTYTIDDISTLSGEDQIFDFTKAGWRIPLNATQSEKILADPAVFGGVAYFTTYTPVNTTDPCEQAGDAKLYAVHYRTGKGVLTDGARSMHLGQGIPSAPVLSLKPGSSGIPDLYVTTSGGGGTSASTQRVNMNPPGAANRTNMLYWKDRRVE